MTNSPEIKNERSVDILLDRLDDLPSPSAVATRLMAIIDGDAVSTKDVIDLIATDPALSARVVGLCARSPRGRALGITDLDRAVILLGFDAVRSAVLSVRLFETLQSFGAEKDPNDSLVFDHNMFWRHSLGVGIFSERIASRCREVQTSTAFLAGLLHDIGHLGLHTVAPRIFSSACELAEVQCRSVDLIAQERIGIDGRTAGRRIGRKWGLPQTLIDAIWLIDQPVSVLQGCQCPELVSVVSLADALMASDQVSIVGHGTRVSAIREHAARLGVDLSEVMAMRSEVLAEVERRALELGLDSNPTSDLLLDSIARANRSVGRFATAYRKKIIESEQCETSLERLTFFLNKLPCNSLGEVVQAISSSARSLMAGSSACLIIPGPAESGPPRIFLSTGDDVSRIEYRAGMPSDIARDVLSRNRLERCGEPIRMRMRDGECAIIALGIPVGSSTAPFDPESSLLSAWCSNLDDALLRERSGLLSERLAHANRELASHRETIARARASSAVAAIAGGAAHEINTPLAVITGRAHLLMECLKSTELEQSAQEIKNAALEAAGIIEALSESVMPIDIRPTPTEVGGLLIDACRSISPRMGNRLSIASRDDLPTALVDARLMKVVLTELIENALRASSESSVVLEAGQIGGDVQITVTDGGPGFSEGALKHGFEPFFSDQPSGRRRGLGLSHARRLIEAHGGTIAISNEAGRIRGGRVSIHLPTTAISAPTNQPSVSSFAGLQ